MIIIFPFLLIPDVYACQLGASGGSPGPTVFIEPLSSRTEYQANKDYHFTDNVHFQIEDWQAYCSFYTQNGEKTLLI